jgi:hypothetical protein
MKPFFIAGLAAGLSAHWFSAISALNQLFTGAQPLHLILNP